MDSLSPEQDLVLQCRPKVRSSGRRIAAGVSHRLIMTTDGISFPAGTSAQKARGTIQSP